MQKNKKQLSFINGNLLAIDFVNNQTIVNHHIFNIMYTDDHIFSITYSTLARKLNTTCLTSFDNITT